MTESSATPSSGEPTTDPSPRTQVSRWRRSLPTVLIALGTVVGLASTLGVWIRTQVLDTDEWVRLSDELLEEDEVTDALTTFVVDRIDEQVDLSDALGDRLPAVFGGVADRLAGALRGPITDAVDSIVTSERFRTVWSSVNRTAHESFVAIVRDEAPPVVGVDDGTVTLELREVIVQVGERLGLSSERMERLPDDAGSVTIVESDQLSAVRGAVALLDLLSWALFLVAIGLFVAAVVVARGHRLRALRDVGMAVSGGGVFLLLVQALAARLVVDSIVEEARNEPLGDVVARSLTSLLREMAWSVIVWGVLVVLFTSLLGPSRRARSVRRRIAPIATASAAAVAGGTVLFVALLAWWSPGRSFDRLVSAIVLIALVIAAVVAVRVQVTREFPRGPTTADDEPRDAGTGGDADGAESTLSAEAQR